MNDVFVIHTAFHFSFYFFFVISKPPRTSFLCAFHSLTKRNACTIKWYICVCVFLSQYPCICIWFCSEVSNISSIRRSSNAFYTHYATLFGYNMLLFFHITVVFYLKVRRARTRLLCKVCFFYKQIWYDPRTYDVSHPKEQIPAYIRWFVVIFLSKIR